MLSLAFGIQGYDCLAAPDESFFQIGVVYFTLFVLLSLALTYRNITERTSQLEIHTSVIYKCYE